jgi:hypothetical protein
MAPKKKTNFISYELERLDKYLRQLTGYLDSNPPDSVVDRIEVVETARGGSVIKVIATKEDQIKLFTATMEKLPKILADVNALRKEVDGAKKDVDIRGNQEQPGFMAEGNDDEEEDDEDDKPIGTKLLPLSTKQKISIEDNPDAFDDDTFYED